MARHIEPRVYKAELLGEIDVFLQRLSGRFATSALMVATAVCLRVIMASATIIQYSLSSFARKIVSGDIHASDGQ